MAIARAQSHRGGAELVGKETIHLLSFAVQMVLDAKELRPPSEDELTHAISEVLEAYEARGVKGLEEKLKDGDPVLWMAAPLALIEEEERRIFELADGKRDGKFVAAAVASLRPQAIDFLGAFERAIPDSDEVLFRVLLVLLLRAVSIVPAKEALNGLEEWLTADSIELRISASKAMAKISLARPELAREATELLSSIYGEDPSVRARESIASSLGTIGQGNLELRQEISARIAAMLRRERSGRVRRALLDGLMSLLGEQ